MEWIYKKIWELKSKALTLENKVRIQKLQQLLDEENQKPNTSEKRDKNNSAKNDSIDSKDSSIRKEEEEIHKFLYNRYNR